MLPQVTYSTVLLHKGDLLPTEAVPSRHPGSHPSPRPRLHPLLVAVGGFPELVSHHFGREVVEVEHVLEEGVLRDLVLVRKRRDEDRSTGVVPHTLARMNSVLGWLCIMSQIGTSLYHGASQILA